MKPIFRSWFRKFKSRIQRRLDKKHDTPTDRPAFSALLSEYDVAHRDRDRAIGYGGIGLLHSLVQNVGLAKAIDEHLHLLTTHLPTTRLTMS